MAHREGIREYLKDVEVYGLVVDWGCGTKPIKNYLKPNNADFITIDKDNRVEADHHLDFEKLLLEDDLAYFQADFAFCLEVIEHLWDANKLIHNIKNRLKADGVLYLSQPFLYPVHKEDDRVRYTYHGLRQLLEKWDLIVLDIQPTVGDLDHAEGYIVKATK